MAAIERAAMHTELATMNGFCQRWALAAATSRGSTRLSIATGRIESAARRSIFEMRSLALWFTSATARDCWRAFSTQFGSCAEYADRSTYPELSAESGLASSASP
jgi:hypothetical protein